MDAFRENLKLKKNQHFAQTGIESRLSRRADPNRKSKIEFNYKQESENSQNDPKRPDFHDKAGRFGNFNQTNEDRIPSSQREQNLKEDVNQIFIKRSFKGSLNSHPSSRGTSGRSRLSKTNLSKNSKNDKDKSIIGRHSRELNESFLLTDRNKNQNEFGQKRNSNLDDTTQNLREDFAGLQVEEVAGNLSRSDGEVKSKSIL